MTTRIGVQITVGLVAVVFAIGVWVTGEPMRADWLRFYSVAVPVVLGAWALWEHYLWHVPLVQRFTKAPRDVRGTWGGRLRSTYMSSEGMSWAPKPVFLVVRQSASSVSVVFLSHESRSKSSLARVHSDEAHASVDFLFVNTPDSVVEARSPMHHGSAMLQISGRPASRLRGRYWTTRGTRGEVDLGSRISRLVDDYEEAERAFYPAVTETPDQAEGPG